MAAISPLRVLPSVQQVYSRLSGKSAIQDTYLIQLIRAGLAACREELKAGKMTLSNKEQALEIVSQRIQNSIDQLQSSSIIKVINATGVVLHTGLGRAPLGSQIWLELATLLNGYVNLEFDLESGLRGERLELNAPLLRLLTGAPASAVVNNNAAAVLLVLNTLAEGREVLVSRGELIEIGGSFRLPEVIAKSGARMVEVGTTNRTHLADYERALTPQTAAILVAHPSNYRIVGFTTQPDRREIVTLGHRHRIPVVMDLGSGILFEPTTVGLPPEPVVRTVVEEDFDLITFSGDKLLGGPQAGIIIGSEKYLKQIRRNPLLRALRCDKLTLTLLNYTLRQYLYATPAPELTAHRLLLTPVAELQQRAENILAQLARDVVQILQIEIQPTQTEAGSGSMPAETIPSVALVLSPKVSEAQLAEWLRQNRPPIIGYRRRGSLYLDLRSVLPEEDGAIVAALQNLYRRLQP